MGELKDRVKGIGNEISGNVKQVAGKAGNDSNLDAEGRGQERKGEAQQFKGKVKGAFGDSI